MGTPLNFELRKATLLCNEDERAEAAAAAAARPAIDNALASGEESGSDSDTEVTTEVAHYMTGADHKPDTKAL